MVKAAETGLAQRPATHTLVAQSEQLPDSIQQVVLTGDLSRLDSNDRALYYLHVCKSLGLNPATRPFEFTQLSGKTVLYAKRDCTDQLRANKNISVTIVNREHVNDLYAVTARATTPDGRTDESMGVVAFGNLKGDNAANALMKAETKAKRRVTLSICGLGFTDETELETIPNRRDIQDAPVASVGVRRVENETNPPEATTRPSAPASTAGEPDKTPGTAGSAQAPEHPRDRLIGVLKNWSGITKGPDLTSVFRDAWRTVGVPWPKTKEEKSSDVDIEKVLAWAQDCIGNGLTFTDAVAKPKVEKVEEPPAADPAPVVNDDIPDEVKEPEAPQGEKKDRPKWPVLTKSSPAQVDYWRKGLLQLAGIWLQTAKRDESCGCSAEDLVTNYEQVNCLPAPGEMSEVEAAKKYKAAAHGAPIDWSAYAIPF